MATVTLRPDSIEEASGFSPAVFLGNINDQDPDTGATQNSATAQIVGTFENSSDYSGATITAARLTVQASTSGKASSCSIQCIIADSDGETLQSDSHDFTSANESQAGTSLTSGLTPSVVDGMQFILNPDTSGCIVKEVSLLITFTVATPDPNPAYVLLNSGKYKITSGKVKIL